MTHVLQLLDLTINKFTKGKGIVANGWKKAGTFDATKLGSSSLPSLDPFADLCPLIESLQLRENLRLSALFSEELDCFHKKIQEIEDDSDSEWEPASGFDDCSEPMETPLMHSMMACD